MGINGCIPIGVLYVEYIAVAPCVNPDQRNMTRGRRYYFPATVSLKAESGSYFDKYLDEIVYYFEVSRRDIVVFEDLDRFDNVQIFETLRALNTLLNGSAQIRKQQKVGILRH